jgi:hypothetical protein
MEEVEECLEKKRIKIDSDNETAILGGSNQSLDSEIITVLNDMTIFRIICSHWKSMDYFSLQVYAPLCCLSKSNNRVFLGVFKEYPFSNQFSSRELLFSITRALEEKNLHILNRIKQIVKASSTGDIPYLESFCSGRYMRIIDEWNQYNDARSFIWRSYYHLEDGKGFSVYEPITELFGMTQDIKEVLSLRLDMGIIDKNTVYLTHLYLIEERDKPLPYDFSYVTRSSYESAAFALMSLMETYPIKRGFDSETMPIGVVFLIDAVASIRRKVKSKEIVHLKEDKSDSEFSRKCRKNIARLKEFDTFMWHYISCKGNIVAELHIFSYFLDKLDLGLEVDNINTFFFRKLYLNLDMSYAFYFLFKQYPQFDWKTLSMAKMYDLVNRSTPEMIYFFMNEVKFSFLEKSVLSSKTLSTYNTFLTLMKEEERKDTQQSITHFFQYKDGPRPIQKKLNISLTSRTTKKHEVIQTRLKEPRYFETLQACKNDEVAEVNLLKEDDIFPTSKYDKLFSFGPRKTFKRPMILTKELMPPFYYPSWNYMNDYSPVERDDPEAPIMGWTAGSFE